MNALPLRRLWWRIEDRMPPRREWLAWAASMACLALMFYLAAWPA